MAAKGTASCEACFAGATYQIRDWIQQTAVSVKYGFSDPEVWARSLDEPVEWTVPINVEDGMTVEDEGKDAEHYESIGAGGLNSALPTPCNAADDAASPLVAERLVAQVVVCEVLPAPAKLLSCGAASSVCSIIPEGGQEAAWSLAEHMRGSVAGALPHVLVAAALALRAAQDSLFQISSEISRHCHESTQLLHDAQRPRPDYQDSRRTREAAQLADSRSQAGQASSFGLRDDSKWLQEQTELHSFLAKFQESKQRSHEPACHRSNSSSKEFRHVPERGVPVGREHDMAQDLLNLHQFLEQSQRSKLRCFVPTGGEARCTSHLAGGHGRHVATLLRGLPLRAVQRPTPEYRIQ